MKKDKRVIHYLNKSAIAFNVKDFTRAHIPICNVYNKGNRHKLLITKSRFLTTCKRCKAIINSNQSNEMGLR